VSQEDKHLIPEHVLVSNLFEMYVIPESAVGDVFYEYVNA